MRMPNSPTESYDVEILYDYYFNIEDENRPNLTPILFYAHENEGFFSAEQRFRKKYHTSTTNLFDNFKSNWSTLKKYHIRDKKYLGAAGTIFRYTIDEETVTQYFPIIITCFNEESDFKEWYQSYNLTFVVNIKELNSVENKLIRPKILKLIEYYQEIYNYDVIFTTDVKKYCINSKPKLKFKSIKEQAEYLKNLVLETV